MRKRTQAYQRKVKKTMGEFKRGTLRSGSKSGPRVKSRKQAIAIALDSARMAEKRSRSRTKRRS